MLMERMPFKNNEPFFLSLSFFLSLFVPVARRSAALIATSA